MQGVNLSSPFLERRQAVFVDFVIFGTTVSDRRTAMMIFLCEHGHFVEEVKNETETLFKNRQHIFTALSPKTVSCQGIPVQERCFLLYPVKGGISNLFQRRTMEAILASDYVSIGELARLTGCCYSTLKHYTEEGMLPFEHEKKT